MEKRRQRVWAFLISWHKVYVLPMIAWILFMTGFVFYSLSQTFEQQMQQPASYLRTFFQQYDSKPMLFLLEQENRYYGQALDKEPFQLGQFFLELSMSISFQNLGSFLLAELPGFRLFDVQLMVEDRESNFTNISREPIPDRAEVDREEEAPTEDKPKTDEKPRAEKRPTAQKLKKRVYIYHTHNRESFQSDEAYSKSHNITLVGKRLGKALADRGIGAEVDTTDIAGEVIQRDWNYAQSYDVSRETVQAYLRKAKDTEFVFDVHRDAIKRDLTTVQIDGKNYARIVFVIGGENKNYKRNLKLATELHHALNQKYKDISRNIVVKKGKGVNGVYNQDLSENALTVEFGGVDNHLNEFYRTADAFAEVFADYLKKEKGK